MNTADYREIRAMKESFRYATGIIKAKSLAEKGYTIAEIAEILGRAPATIRLWLKN